MPFRPASIALLLTASLLPATAAWAATAKRELPALDCVVNPNQIVDVSSPVPGVLAEVLVERSGFIEEGDVVARLAAGVEQAGVDLARARTRLEPEISASQVNLEFDEKRRTRLESLFGSDSVSEQNIDEAEREVRLSSWKLEQARNQQHVRDLELKRAEELLAQKTIRATLSGVVLQRFKYKGEYVEDNPIVRIAQLDPLRIDAIVPMDYFGTIRPNMTAMVHPGPGAAGQVATVTVVDPVGDPGSGTFGVQLALPNPELSIPAGMRCEMRFLPASEADVAASESNLAPSPTASATACPDGRNRGPAGCRS